MPHAELKYSDDLAIDTDSVFEAIENTILAHDSGSGDCKCRAYPTDQYRHTHVLVTVSMLTKAHRDAAFTENLMQDLESAVKKHLDQDCFFSLSLDYSSDYYVTNEHRV